MKYLTWILAEFGVGWADAELGWDRAAHAAAIRDHAARKGTSA